MTTARTGRAKLRTALTQAAEPGGGCDCARCCPPPLTDLEAQRALRHVSDHQAVAYARAEAVLAGCHDCPDCGAWVPTFMEAARPAARR